MIRGTLIFFLSWTLTLSCYADRIYILNSPGYNTAEPNLIKAIEDNGHTVVVQTTNLSSLPTGFTSSCKDSKDGYDWLCFFGNTAYTSLTSEIKKFIDSGGKVFYQYEVSCCQNSSSSVATILSSLTGRTITPNSNGYIALGSKLPAYEAIGINCCISFYGNAYKGLDGLPLVNQLQATASLSTSKPPIDKSLNFGFKFKTTDFTGSANNGAMFGLGDINIWYDGKEPNPAGGSNPVNAAVVDYIFPNSSSICYAFSHGCYDSTTSVKGGTSYLRNDTVLCKGDTLTFDVTKANAKYLWNDGDTNAKYTITEAGTYWVELTIDSCTIIDSIVVTIKPPYLINLGTDTILCKGDTLTLDVATSNATYLWQDNTKASSFKVSKQGTYFVEIKKGNCSSRDSIDVNFKELPNVDLGKDTSICFGAELFIDASTFNATYSWQDNSTDPIHEILQNGTFWVDVTVDKCTVRDSVNVYYKLPPVVDLGGDTALCPQTTLVADVSTPNATYLWQDGSTNATYEIAKPGFYWVEVTQNQCKAKDSFDVTIKKLTPVKLGSDTSFCEGESTKLDATTSNASYLWTDNSIKPTLTVTQKGKYWVEITVDHCGFNSDTVSVEIEQCHCELSIPNSFTPNLDNLNDQFSPILGCNVNEYQLLIYNLWGEQIFETSNQFQSWNGFYKGSICQNGIYIYILSYRYGEERKRQSGQINLIR